MQRESYLDSEFTIIFLLSKYKAVKKYNRFITIGELSEQMQIVPYINFTLQYGLMTTAKKEFKIQLSQFLKIVKNYLEISIKMTRICNLRTYILIQKMFIHFIHSLCIQF